MYHLNAQNYILSYIEPFSSKGNGIEYLLFSNPAVCYTSQLYEVFSVGIVILCILNEFMFSYTNLCILVIFQIYTN